MLCNSQNNPGDQVIISPPPFFFLASKRRFREVQNSFKHIVAKWEWILPHASDSKSCAPAFCVVLTPARWNLLYFSSFLPIFESQPSCKCGPQTSSSIPWELVTGGCSQSLPKTYSEPLGAGPHGSSSSDCKTCQFFLYCLILVSVPFKRDLVLIMNFILLNAEI